MGLKQLMSIYHLYLSFVQKYWYVFVYFLIFAFMIGCFLYQASLGPFKWNFERQDTSNVACLAKVLQGLSDVPHSSCSQEKEKTESEELMEVRISTSDPVS